MVDRQDEKKVTNKSLKEEHDKFNDSY